MWYNCTEETKGNCTSTHYLFCLLVWTNVIYWFKILQHRSKSRAVCHACNRHSRWLQVSNGYRLSPSSLLSCWKVSGCHGQWNGLRPAKVIPQRKVNRKHASIHLEVEIEQKPFGKSKFTVRWNWKLCFSFRKRDQGEKWDHCQLSTCLWCVASLEEEFKPSWRPDL